MRQAKKRRLVLGGLFIAILLAVVILAWPAPARPSGSNTSGTTSPPAGTPLSSFNRSQYSLTDPASIWVVVNKQHPLNPISYAPSDLVVPNVPLRVPGNQSMQVRQATGSALEALFQAAKDAGNPLMLSSGYRSYSYQVGLYNSYVKTSGVAGADQFSARPGFSEHQTGLAVDVEPLNQQCDVDQCFAQLPAGKWLAANAYKYGFLLRYPADKVAITGYSYEPWHIRYIGTTLSNQLNGQHIETLEEFFGITGGQSYKN